MAVRLTTDDILVVLVAAIDDPDHVQNMDAMFKSGDRDERAVANFVDRFISEAIEAGLLDADDHWNSQAWQDAVLEVHPELEEVDA